MARRAPRRARSRRRGRRCPSRYDATARPARCRDRPVPQARPCWRDRRAAAPAPCPARCERKMAADRRERAAVASRPYSAKIAEMKDAEARALLRDLFDAALAAARPATCLAPYVEKLQPPPLGSGGRTIVIGAGKASAAMAKAVEDQ